MDFLKDLFGFLMKRKKFWLIPVIAVLIVIALLAVLSSASAIAPFIYAIF